MTEAAFQTWAEERAHWLELYLRLPEAGVALEFPNESICERRLAHVRWPDGPICPSCSEKNAVPVKSRKPLSCKNCQKQFSATSGTFLHGRKLDLRLYFLIAETLIKAEALRSMATGHGIKDEFQIAYATAVRLKKKIRQSLLETTRGIISRCICVGDLSVQQDIEPGTEHYSAWLETEFRARRQRKSNFE